MRVNGGKPKRSRNSSSCSAKPIKIVVARKLNGWAERRKCLHEHLAFDVPASRTTCDLSQKLKGTFSRPEVG